MVHTFTGMLTITTRDLEFSVSDIVVHGILSIPPESDKLVVFSHGSGSSRLSPRNTYVAGVLNKCGISTLLTDLLSPEEDQQVENRFNIPLLANRLSEITAQVAAMDEFREVPVGFFGASTGAASALTAAAKIGSGISAVVSRGGRPDLAGFALSRVSCPTLFIVGAFDETCIPLNEEAYSKLKCTKNMIVVPGAGHLFEEPGKLEEVAKLAAEWFENYL